MNKLNRDCKIRWLGHAAFHITTATGKSILIDPWLSNPLAPDGVMDSIDAIDVLLLTHGHSDHLGEAITLAKRFKPAIPCAFEMSVYLEKKGVANTSAMNKGGTQIVADDIKVTMVSADHSSGIIDEELSPVAIYGGEAAGFVVELENGFRFYHAGDTNVFAEMEMIGRLYDPEVVMLPIGGHFTMGPKEAGEAIRLLKPKYVVPMHYGTFPILAGTPEDLRMEIAGSGVEVLMLKPGDTLT